MKAKVFLLVVVVSAAVLISGCGWFEQVASGVSTVVGTGDTAIVIAKTAEIRTSYAVVAGDLLEVKRGDRLDVLDQVESRTQRVRFGIASGRTTKAVPRVG
jgi:hypothetical protein